MRAFMDNLALLNRAREPAAAILRRLEELMDWGQLAFKAKKSRSLVLKNGKLDKEFSFSLGEEVIPSVSDQPVKSLDHWYTKELRDTKREIKRQLEEGLKAIDECGLPGKLKLWCLQFGSMPRFMWPLTVYEVVMSHVEHMGSTLVSSSGNGLTYHQTLHQWHCMEEELRCNFH